MLLGIFGESLLLAVHPVLVESSQSVLIQLLSPNSGQGSQSSRSVNVTNHSDHSHGGSLNNGDSFDDFLLVDLESSSVNFSKNVGHSCLESSKGSQMARLGLIILGEVSNSSSESLGSSSWQESQMAVSRS